MEPNPAGFVVCLSFNMNATRGMLMTKFAAAFAAAAMLFAVPSFSTGASAATASGNMQMAQVNVRIGGGGVHRDMRRHPRCTTTVVYRHGRKSVVKRCR
jgi:hypothetical protein